MNTSAESRHDQNLRTGVVHGGNGAFLCFRATASPFAIVQGTRLGGEPVWNPCKELLFLLHPAKHFPIGEGRDAESFGPMIICSCNVFSDHDVRTVVTDVAAGADLPRTAGQVYGCLGCSAQCGRCARTIKQIMAEALGPCVKACCEGCPHSHQPESGQAGPVQHRGVTADIDLQIAAA